MRYARNLNLSEKGISLLKWMERLRLSPYDDQTGKAIQGWLPGATIGYGHLIPQAQWDTFKNGISLESSDILLLADIAPRETIVNEAVKVPLEQHQFDALVIFIYNIGSEQFLTSSALKLINDVSAKTRFPSLEPAWKAFNKSQGKVNKGLINRRNSEWLIYSQNLYKNW